MKSCKILFALHLALAALPAFAAGEKPVNVIEVQKRYQNLLLKLNGVQLVMTGTCDRQTGALRTDIDEIGPAFPCIAVKFRNTSDLPPVESVYSNPLMLDGALIHFTDADPIPGRGGITVHN